MFRLRISIVSLLLTFPIIASGADFDLCDQVILDRQVTLSENEKILVCGTSESRAWERIPLPQARYHLNIFLQNRGYFSPQYEIRNDRLYVKVGEPTKIEDVYYSGQPPVFQRSIKRKMIGSRMTPDQLNELQDWSTGYLRANGYACPTVTLSADPPTESVTVHINPGPRLRIAEVKRPAAQEMDVNTEVLERYDAFVLGQYYNADFLDLTSLRLVNHGLVQNAYFETACTPDGAVLTQRVVYGKPRLLRVGIGASTEEFPFLDLLWRNSRLNARASSISVEGHFSPLSQRATVESEIFFFVNTPRASFAPQFTIERIREEAFELLRSVISVHGQYTMDTESLRAIVRAGPSWNYVDTVTGAGPEDLYYGSLDARLTLISHYYEYLAAEPRKGYFLQVQSRSQREGLGSLVSADLFEFQGKFLSNYKDYDPPLLVAGLRFHMATTESSVSLTSRGAAELPQEFRHYLGGDANIRGFARNRIDNDDLGYLTFAYAGIELRLVEVLPFRLQPLVFVDAAKVGEASLELNETLFYSPGLGMRWASPIGTVRATAAKGYVDRAVGAALSVPEEWVYFVSLGGEF